MRKQSDVIKGKIRVLCDPLSLIVLINPCVIGGYYEWASCLISLYLICYLIVTVIRRGALKFPKSITMLATLTIPAAFTLSVFWATDSGMAPIGAVKFLPLPLFAVAIAQIDYSKRRDIISLLPLSGVIMTVLSFLLGLVAPLRGFFYINNRLAGFFQYPNTFALYLLIGIITIVSKDKLDITGIIALSILFSGVFLSGSRTVMVMLFLTVIAVLFTRRSKKVKFITGVISGSLLLISALYVVFTGNYASVGRYLTTSFTQSTFLGRLLYIKDALPIIAKHPFGLGYYGYYFLQGSFQTGVYSVINIHNDFLQIFLDIGWIPAGVVIFAVAERLWKCRHITPNFFIIAAVCVHALFDFDLQFIPICFVLILAAESENANYITASVASFGIAATVTSVICCYFGVVSCLYFLGEYRTAVKIYPCYTMALVQLLPEVQDIQELDSLAEKILALNDSVALAHSAKAKVTYADGDFANVILHKKKAIYYAAYSLDEYLDYFDMLLCGIKLYAQYGDSNSVEICKASLFEIPDMLSRVERRTSSLAWRITDKPVLTLPAAYSKALNELRSGS